jgi:hypothetical protein
VFRQDYILRMIEQLGAFLRRISGLSDRGQHDEALAEAGRAWGELIDVPRELVEVLESHALAELLREPVKMRTAARLLAAEARALAGKGDPMNGAVLYRRAIELTLEAGAADPAGKSRDDEALLLELARHVHGNQLDARYQT